MGTITGGHLRRLAIDQQVQHVSLDGTVDNCQLFAVVQRIQHRHFQRGAVGDRRFTRLQIDLYTVSLGKGLETDTEAIQRIAFAGEVDTTTQTHPLDSLQQRAEALLDLLQHAVEQVEITVLAVVVDHEAGDQRHHLFDLVSIPLAQTAERSCRVGNQPVGTADLGIEAQAAHMVGRGVRKALQLTDGVEDDLVRVGQHLFNLVVGIGDAVSMGLPAELALAQLDLIKGGRGGAVHVLTHQIEHRPGSKAFESEQRPGPGVLAQIGDFLHVAQQLALVDQVIRRLDHDDWPSIGPAQKPSITQTRDYRAKNRALGGISTGKSSNGAGERRDARAQARAGGSEVVTQTDGGEVDIVLISHVLIALILGHQFDLRCKGIGGPYTKRRNPLVLCITDFYKATRTTCFHGDLCFQLVVAQLAKKLETIKGQCSDEVDTIPISVPGQLGGPTITGCSFIFGGAQVSVLEFDSDVTVQLNSGANLEGGILIVPGGAIT